MEWDSIVKLLHVGIAFGLVSGLMGRWILLTRAAASDDVEAAHGLAKAASPFTCLPVRFDSSLSEMFWVRTRRTM